MDETKTCPRCGETKPKTSEHFYVRSAGYLYSWCKTCQSAYVRSRADPEAVRARTRQWRTDNPERYAEYMALKNAKARAKRAEARKKRQE
jgi:hypothetical protein